MVRIGFLLISLIFFGCSQSRERIPGVKSENISKSKIIIYQVFTRLFGNSSGENTPYGTIKQNGVGKFNDISDQALRSIRDLGVTHVWYTGIIEHAQLSDYTRYGIKLDDADVVKGRAGSPYAIKDYYDVDPDLAVDVPGRMKEFEGLVKRTHDNGLKVIIDFVPNHVARRYESDAKPQGVRDLGVFDDKTASFKPDNNFYYLPGTSFKVPERFNPLDSLTFSTEDGKFDETPAKATGNDQFTAQPGMHEWFETVKLNYGIDIQNNSKKYFDPIPDTWSKMRDILVYWTRKGVDGFRCDMAQMVPVEFWAWVIPQVKAINLDIIFIAEIYEPSLYRSYIDEGRFDYLYDKVQLYDTLRQLISGAGNAHAISTIQESLLGVNSRMLHFLENHDEQRIASSYFAGDPWKAVPAMVISATIDKGPVMLYFGQELGERGKGVEGFGRDDGRTTIFDYWCVPTLERFVKGNFTTDSLTLDQDSLRTFYSTLLKVARDNPAIVNGDYMDATQSVKGSMSGRLLNAYFRWTADEKLLIVSNFMSSPTSVRLNLTDFIKTVKIDTSKNLSVTNLLDQEILSEFVDHTFSIEMPANGSFILKIEEQ